MLSVQRTRGLCLLQMYLTPYLFTLTHSFREMEENKFDIRPISEKQEAEHL